MITLNKNVPLMKLFSAKEAVNQRRTANKIVKRKRTKAQTAIYKNTSKTLDNMNSTNSCAPER